MPTTKFCTVADVQVQINQQPSFTQDNAAITAAIKLATAQIRKFTRRNWERGTYTQFFTTRDIDIAINYGRGVASFSLLEKPIQSITSVKYHAGGDWDNATPLDSTYYQLDPLKNQLVMYPSRMNAIMRALRVDYVAGYEADVTDTELLLVDTNLSMACAIQAGFIHLRNLQRTSGTGKKTDKSGSKEYNISAAGFVSEAQALLRGEATPFVGSS